MKTTLAFVALLAITLPASAKPDIAKLANQCNTLGKESACRELAKIALEDKEDVIRGGAVDELNDQTVLAKIAEWDRSSEVREKATRKLTDQALLSKIVLHDESNDVCEAAVQNPSLVDQALLANIAIVDSNEQISRTAVTRLTDQGLLANVAEKARDAEVGRDAVKKLTDQTSLARIATDNVDFKIRFAATRSLTDYPLLLKVAAGTSDETIRLTATVKLTDQLALAKVALDSHDAEVRRYAVKLLAEQRSLEKAAAEGSNESRRLLASIRLGVACMGMAPKWKIDVRKEDLYPIRSHYIAHIIFEDSPTLAEDMSLFRELLNTGADPNLVRIAGYSKPTEDALTGVTRNVTPEVTVNEPLVSGGKPGEVVLAEDGGMTLRQYLEENGLKEAVKLLDSLAK